MAEVAEVEQMAIEGDDEGGLGAECTSEHVVIVGVRADGGFDRRRTHDGGQGSIASQYLRHGTADAREAFGEILA